MVDCPDIFDKSDEIIIKDKRIIESLEDIIMGWERQITRIIEIYQAKVLPDWFLFFNFFLINLLFYTRRLHKVMDQFQNTNTGTKGKPV